ncbi:putative glycosidase C21B10.07 [Exophiala dermatitidis]|uniref:endo-1,3(4)-beta-glucanase n=1 Tax=Exophiala dermatitidis (strain ATCC 34100 / CBS 525.76 / NIH/UT8656) TaxID=858893 RepID=H6CBG7_EXODN|nr:endo-1,3(4)-beta-glucanase [Exophiala dermatitidis NIH/UT8656]EHY61114.1 endo-1,3(4)-beta-glucanase [Exophiala dermatitidis NIH/UT8656]
MSHNYHDAGSGNYGQPPPYSQTQFGSGHGAAKYASVDIREGGGRSRLHPKTWSRKCWILLAIGAIIVIVIAIVVPVVVSRNNRYPNYSSLNYSLVATYSGTSFFDNFDYFTGYDPASGFVHYVDAEGSASLNLTYASSTSAVLRVDLSDTDTTTGRKSARITSKDTYDNGLFIFDVVHSPYGCATWPALWLSDPSNWPTNGEIDVMEATNMAPVGNQVTLHTTKHCTMGVKRKETGKALRSNCLNSTDGDSGCGVRGSTATFGEEFNNNGGGVYAMELRDAGIRVWFFDRDNIPDDINTSTSNSTNSTTTPDPSTWSEALADFPSTDCNIANHFRNQSIIVDIDLCGDWAGQTAYFNTQSGCSGTCVNYVSEQPGSAYENAYWEFRSFRVYQA